VVVNRRTGGHCSRTALPLTWPKNSALLTIFDGCHSLDGAIIYFTKLIQIKYTTMFRMKPLILCQVKFGADLITISKATGHKTKWPRFLAYMDIARKDGTGLDSLRGFQDVCLSYGYKGFAKVDISEL